MPKPARCSGARIWLPDQTQSATYNVYTNPNAFINVADNPAPLSPGPVNPTLGTQGTIIHQSQREPHRKRSALMISTITAG